MWGSTQMPTTKHRHTGKLEPLDVEHTPEDFSDDVSVSSSVSQQRRRRPRRLPPASQQAQYARRLEIEAIEAKNRFTRELLQSHFTLLESHAKEVKDVMDIADDGGSPPGEGASGEGRPAKTGKIAARGDGGKSSLEQQSRSRKKKKKKERKKECKKPERKVPLTVDTSKAKSSVEVLRISLNELGWFWKEYCTIRRVPCDLYWHGVNYYDNDRLPPGKVNKFPGLQELVRKAQLSKLLSQMQQLFPEEYEFYPKTWLLPEQFHQFCADAELMYQKNPKHSPIFIVKPDCGSQGDGIYLINDPHKLSSIGLVRPAVVQEYVAKPLLLERTKFDLRVYVLLASIEPLQVYICREGMARFCTMKYQEPTTQNLHQVYMHLTNYSLNKHSESFVHTNSGDKGSKRTMTSAFASLANRGHDTLQLWEEIEELVIKTITAILPDLKVAWQAELAMHKIGPTCFQWDDDGEKCGMVCIWKWKVLTTLPMNIQARQPTLPKPVLDDHLPLVLRSECQNCFPRPKAKVQQGPPPQAAATPGQGPPPHAAATPSQGPPPHAAATSGQGPPPQTAATSGQGPPPQAAATPDQVPQPQTAATPGQGPPTAGPPAPQRNTTTQQEDEEIFHVMGSWKDDENNYPVTLQKVEKLMEAGENVPVRVRFDSKNKEDINAIAVDAFVDNSWCIVGDIKKHEIPKLTKAMRHDKVIACEFPSKPKYKINIMNSGCNGLMVNVRITRRGKWGKDDDEYRYNKDLTNLEKY